MLYVPKDTNHYVTIRLSVYVGIRSFGNILVGSIKQEEYGNVQLVSQTYGPKKILVLYMVTTKYIEKDTELRYEYQPSDRRKTGSGSRKCNCGTRFCKKRGFPT